MGPPSYTRSVADRNVVMRHMPVICLVQRTVIDTLVKYTSRGNTPLVPRLTLKCLAHPDCLSQLFAVRTRNIVYRSLVTWTPFW